MQHQNDNHKDILWNSLAQQAQEQRERKRDKNYVAGKIGAPPSYVHHETHNSGLLAPEVQRRRSVRSLSPLERFNLANNDDRLRALMPQEAILNEHDIPQNDGSPTSFNPKARRSTWDRFVHASDEQRLSKLMSSGEGPLVPRSMPTGGNGTSLAIGSEYAESDDRKTQYKNFLLRQIEEKQQRKKNENGDYGGWFNNESRQIRNAREYHGNGNVPQSSWSGAAQNQSPHIRGTYPPHSNADVTAEFGGLGNTAARKEAVKNDLLAQIEENKARREAAKSEEMESDRCRFQPGQEVLHYAPSRPSVEPWDYHRPDVQPRTDSRFGGSLKNDWGVSQNTSLSPITDAPDDALVQRNKVMQLKNDLEIQIEERKRAKLAEKERERAEEERIERDVQRVAKEAQDRVDTELERKREKALEDDKARLQVAAMVQRDVEDRKSQQNRKSIAVHEDRSPVANRSVGSAHGFQSGGADSVIAGHFSHSPLVVESPPQEKPTPTTFGKNIRDVDHRSFEHDIAPVRKWHGDHQTPENVRRYYNYDQRSDSVAREDFNQPLPRPLSVAVLEEVSPFTDKSSVPHHFIDPSPLNTIGQPGPILVSQPIVFQPIVEPDSFDDGGPDSLEGSRMIIHDPDTPGRPPVRHIPNDGQNGVSSMNGLLLTLDQDTRQLYSPSPKRYQPTHTPQHRELPESCLGHSDAKQPEKVEELVTNNNHRVSNESAVVVSSHNSAHVPEYKRHLSHLNPNTDAHESYVNVSEGPLVSGEGQEQPAQCETSFGRLSPIPVRGSGEDDVRSAIHDGVVHTSQYNVTSSPLHTSMSVDQTTVASKDHLSPKSDRVISNHGSSARSAIHDSVEHTSQYNVKSSLLHTSRSVDQRKVASKPAVQYPTNRPPNTYKSFLDDEDRMSVGPSARFDVRHYNTIIDHNRKELPPVERISVVDSDVDRHGRILSSTFQSRKLLPLEESQRRRSHTIGGLSQLERDLMAEVAAMARERYLHLSPLYQRPIEVHVIEEDYPGDNFRRTGM